MQKNDILEYGIEFIKKSIPKKYIRTQGDTARKLMPAGAKRAKLDYEAPFKNYGYDNQQIIDSIVKEMGYLRERFLKVELSGRYNKTKRFFNTQK